MSYSIGETGKAPEVARKVAEVLASFKCPEPEERIKGLVAEAIAAALAQFPPDQSVCVEANGSQSHPDSDSFPDQKINQLSLKIEPIWSGDL